MWKVDRPSPSAIWLIPALCVCQVVLVTTAWAQTSNFDEVEVQGTAYYTFVRSGEVRIEVLALGTVKSPGLYAVGLGTTLDEFLALTGGTSLGTRSGDAEVSLIVRLYRDVRGKRMLIYEEPLERVLVGTEEYPVLQDGDALMVETIVRQQWFTLDRMLSLFSTAATLVLLILRLEAVAN